LYLGFGNTQFFVGDVLLFLLLLTGIRLWAQICAHLNFELRDCLITFPIIVLSQRLIARNVRELFSFNRGILHLNKARRIDDVCE
jgi:hypothetical protein